MHAARFLGLIFRIILITDWAVRGHRPDPFSELWRKVGLMVQPTDAEFIAMLDDLNALVGADGRVADLLRVSVRTLHGWREERHHPETAAKSLVWLTWALCLHPERCQDLLDLATWGRFRKVRVRQPKSLRTPTTDSAADPPIEYNI